VTGVFSLLDTMLGMPLEKALDALALPEPVVAALLHNEGPLAPFLALTIACETADDEVFARWPGPKPWAPETAPRAAAIARQP
jgi:c-di-GMP-related signal transduction protein